MRKSGRCGSYADVNEYLQDNQDDGFQFHISQNEFLERGLFPFSVKFLQWQESTIGNFIEFEIQITNNEGVGSDQH